MCTKLNSKEVEQMLEGVSGVPEKEFDTELFVEKLCDRVVRFYYYLNKIRPNSQQLPMQSVFMDACEVVTGAGLVTLDRENDKIFLYALDPMEFLRVDKSGIDLLWKDLGGWVKEKYGFTLCIAKYDVKEVGKGEPIYKYTKEYLWHTWQMVYDDAMTFEEAFLGD